MTDRLEQERAEFHDLLMRNGFAADTTHRLNGGRGNYRDAQIHAMWCGWLGRAKWAADGVREVDRD